MSSNFCYQRFVTISRNLEGQVEVFDDVLLFHEQETYLTTSLDENCIKFASQMDRKCYVSLRQTFSALKLKVTKGRV